MILVPTDNPGFNLVRPVPVMGHDGGPGHCEIRYEDCRVPAANLLGPRRRGFVIAQDRLGPGRIHHCMRAIGTAERAIEMMCRRRQRARDVRRPSSPRSSSSRTSSPSRGWRSTRRACSRSTPPGRWTPRQAGGPPRDLDDQGGRRERRHGRPRPRDPGPRLARDVRRHAARLDVALQPDAADRRRPRRGPQDGHRPARAQPLGEAARGQRLGQRRRRRGEAGRGQPPSA